MNLLARACRILLAASAALLVVWSFARVVGRGQSLPADGDAVELVVMHWSGDAGQEEDAIVEDLLDRFEQSNPGVVVRRINPGDMGSFYTKLQTMSAAGSPPDLFYVGSERLAALAGAGIIQPVDRFLAADAEQGLQGSLDLDGFYPATVDAFRFDGEVSGQGRLYGIPKDFTTIGFYANKDLFSRAGLPLPHGGWTWEEFAETCRAIGALTDEGGRHYTGAEFVTWPTMVRVYLGTEGVDVADPTFDSLRLRDPAVFGALDRLRSWRHDEENTLTSGRSKVATGSSVFLTGRVGLAGPFGRWVVPSYRKIDTFEWDFVPLPRGAFESNAVFTVAWAVSSRTEHPEEAWSLVRHLCGEEGQKAAAPLGLAVPTLRSVAESELFLDRDLAPEHSRTYLDQAEHAQALRWPANTKFEVVLGQQLDRAIKSGDSTLDEAIAGFESAWALEQEAPLARESFPPMPWRWWTHAALIAAGAVLALLLPYWWVRRPRRLHFREELAGYALVSPWVFGFFCFLAFPIGVSLLLSFTKWNGMTTIDHAEWVGLANYAQLLAHDERFRTSLRVTAYYALLAVPLGQAVALGAAMLLNTRVRGLGLFRSAWYLPSVLAGVGVAVLWRWVFDGDHGLLNRALTPLLAPLGAEPPLWLDADAAVWGPPAFALMGVWSVGGPMMIYLAGLKGVPRDLYEAASIDGAGAWRRFWSVTLPMLSPVLFFNLIMAVIGSFQVFTQAFVMTGGEPGDLTRFYVLYLYNQAFEFYEMGYASAMAWLLLVLILLMTLVVMRGSRRLVYYEALEA